MQYGRYGEADIGNIIALPTCAVWAAERSVAIDETLMVCSPLDVMPVQMVDDTPLTPRAKVELADVMIKRWELYKRRAIVEAGG